MTNSHEYMTLTDAAQSGSIAGLKLSRVTLWRWCQRGMRHTRIGKRIFITADAVSEFLAANETNNANG